MRRAAMVLVMTALLGACVSDYFGSGGGPSEDDAPPASCVDQYSAALAPTANMRAVTLPADTLYPSDPQHIGAELVHGEWHFVGPSYMYYPLPVAAGDRIVGFSWQISKRTGPNEIAASIQQLGALPQTIQGSVSDERYAQCGELTIGTSQIDHLVADGERYILRVAENGADGSDTFRDAVVFVAP